MPSAGVDQLMVSTTLDLGWSLRLRRPWQFGTSSPLSTSAEWYPSDSARQARAGEAATDSAIQLPRPRGVVDSPVVPSGLDGTVRQPAPVASIRLQGSGSLDESWTDDLDKTESGALERTPDLR